MSKPSLTGIYLVPGLPHILQCADQNKGYAALQSAMRKVGDDIVKSGAKRIVYYSTQWIAVLDQMFQARAHLKGMHVDENWYDYGNLPFDMKVDRQFAERLGHDFRNAGHKVRLVDFDGFPVDTGTIVADTLINEQGLPTGIMANNVYSDFEKTKGLGALVRRTIETDGVPTAVVAVSGLSGRFFTTPIDLREDHIRESSDDTWNQTILDHWKKGEFAAAEEKIPAYAQQARVDMGFKAYALIRGMEAFEKPAQVLAYGSVYGTGAAVVKMTGDNL